MMLDPTLSGIVGGAQKCDLASIAVMSKKQLVSREEVAKPFTTVVLIHGIRTQASWAEMVAAVMRDECHVDVVPIRYGYFDVFKFISPFGTRSAATKKVLRELRSVLRREEPRRVLVIAHSFGSYLVTKILADEGDIEFGGLVLCGSVVDDKYRWDLARSRVADRVVNECGDQNAWPVLASKISWGYGPSGTTGFGSSNVRDRFHDLTHSGFFSVDFVRTFWVPLVVGWKVVGTPFEIRRGVGPWWRGPLIALPLKTLVRLGGFCLAATIFLPNTTSALFVMSPSAPVRISESTVPDAAVRAVNASNAAASRPPHNEAVEPAATESAVQLDRRVEVAGSSTASTGAAATKSVETAGAVDDNKRTSRSWDQTSLVPKKPSPRTDVLDLGKARTNTSTYLPARVVPHTSSSTGAGVGSGYGTTYSDTYNTDYYYTKSGGSIAGDEASGSGVRAALDSAKSDVDGAKNAAATAADAAVKAAQQAVDAAQASAPTRKPE